MLIMKEPEYRGLETIISGGQLGADQGGLEAARSLGVATFGYAPKGYRTNMGPDLRLRDVYGLAEHASPDYAGRTRLNVASSDGTIIIASNARSPGSRMTAEAAEKYGKPLFITTPFLSLDDAEMKAELIRDFILNHKIKTLNVAGNRDYEPGGTHYTAAYALIAYAICLLRMENLA